MHKGQTIVIERLAQLDIIVPATKVSTLYRKDCMAKGNRKKGYAVF